MAALLAVAAGLAAPSATGAGGVAIVGLDGVDLGRWSGRGDLTGSDAHCVAVGSGHGSPHFHLRASGDGPGGRFELTDGVTALPFEVRYDDGGGAKWLDPDETLSHLEGHRRTRGQRPCAAGGRGVQQRLEIRVRAGDLARAPAGRFRGRVHLTVLPE
ncbi:MAG: hypothetical protein GVY33_15955 [Alphaproteobacteria bacterium]|nr:hypothetical protein [Alphaproteobacteria bacterium]